MLRIVVAAFVLLLAGSPAQPSRAAEKEGATKVSRELRAIAKSNNRFAFDLYSRLRRKDGNLFFSPTSISTALAMTYAGAEGDTEKEMATVLRFTLPESEVHPAFASLMATLNAPKKDTELRIANRLWGQTGYGFLPGFIATTGKQYGAELAEVDFLNGTEKSRQEINVWVERQTNDKITELLRQGAVSSSTRLVLTNAIYFNGKWRHEFRKKATTNAPFTVSATEKVDVPLMFQKESSKYGETGELQFLEMPYKGEDLSMLILLPKKVDGLRALEKELTAGNLEKWTSSMQRPDVETYLPQFKLTAEFQLNSVLAEMGMPSAFDPGKADFSGMNGQRDLFISAAIHKAFVDVNEEGTEAAAATAVVADATFTPEPAVFRADHPFVFMIRENRTGSILFMGRVTNPKP
jgi:serpin B